MNSLNSERGMESEIKPMPTDAEKKAGWDRYHADMRKKEEDAKVLYAKQVEEDKGKTYMDILPPEFKTFKRSIIKHQIIEAIKTTTKFLNECSLYDGRVFTELEVARYTMRGTMYNNFYLAQLYIPRKDSIKLHYSKEFKYDELPEEEQNRLRKPYDDLSQHLQWLKQSWEAWESRLRVKAGKGDEFNEQLEENGAPRTGRGNLCSIFTPVKGKWLKDQKGVIKMLNPRNKKIIKLTIEKYIEDEDIYICVNEQGKKMYLTSFESVEEAWSCLYDINKEIFSGWWNKTLIWK